MNDGRDLIPQKVKLRGQGEHFCRVNRVGDGNKMIILV
jgi:hypothetical protein